MSRRVFTQALSSIRLDDPVTFALGGHHITGWDNGRPIVGDEWVSQDFHCLPEMPATALDDLTTSVVDAGDGTRYNVPSVIKFLCAVMVPTEVDAFNAVLRDPTVMVSSDTLVQVMQYVTEELSGGRPTQR